MISQYDKQTHFVYCYKRISIYYDYDCVEICATLVCNKLENNNNSAISYRIFLLTNKR